MALTQEQYDQLPDFVKGDYEKFGDGYRTKGEGKAESLKSSLNELNGKFKSAESRIAEIEAAKAQEIESARAEALKQAKSAGDVDAAQQQYEQQMEDLRKRSQADIDKERERGDKYANMLKASKRESFMANLRSKLGIFEDCAEDFEDLVAPLVDFDPETGKKTFFERGGGATSLDEAGFIDSIKSRPAVMRLMKAQPTAEGGQAQGNNGSGGGASKRFDEYTGAELKEIRQKDPAKYDRLKNEFNATGA